MENPEITPRILLQAYASGLFPMADARDSPTIFWVDPKSRGVLPLGGFHLSRSLARRMRKPCYQASLNRDFPAVVSACADRQETWINQEIFDLYSALHRLGHAHSLEIWRDDQLIGGVYGVTLGAAFFGESMFSRATDASKMALAHLVCRLRQTEFQLFDTQFLTPHLASLGGVEISRADYHTALRAALAGPAADIRASDPLAPVQEVIQRSTQTS